MRWIRIAVLGLTLLHCGGESSTSTSWRNIAARCASPRAGTDPFTGQPYPDKKATLDDEKKWLKAWTDDTYLWYSEVDPSLNPATYDSATAYFADLKTKAKTPSNNDKDRFHFWYSTADWEQLSQSGAELGYGITWVVLSAPKTLPRQWVVGYVEPTSPADGRIMRGAQLKFIDGVNMETANTQAEIDVLNAGLSPANLGEQHTYTVLDPGQTSNRDVPLQAAVVTSNPVPDPRVVTTTTGKVGYMLFNDHIATAEQKLINAVASLKAQGITDLVLDIRYNGGGYLAIASEIAYMIAGSARTTGKTFEELKFNDKHPSIDPVTGQQISPTPFFSQALGFSAQTGTALPTLDLPRVFVLTGPGTCSASESVLNSLDGVGVQVIQIGKTTCGKPYGFYPEDNCGTTYFSIQFKGVNAKAFGDYTDGFAPAATAPVAGFTGCVMADDFTHALGDPGENRLETALNYSVTGSCGTPAAASALTRAPGIHGDGYVVKPAWRQNRILGLPRGGRR